MSDAYEDDMAAEEELMARMAAAEERGEADDLEATEAPSALLGKRGRPPKVDPVKLVAWRQGRKASVSETAIRWRVSEPTVKRLCREYGEAAKVERARYQNERLDHELASHESRYLGMFNYQRLAHLNWVSLSWFSKLEAAKGTEQEAVLEAEHDAALDEADRAFRADWERVMGPIPE